VKPSPPSADCARSADAPAESADSGAVAGLGPEPYAAWRASKIGVLTEALERKLVLDLCGDLANRRVLDVGCGDGDFAIDVWQRHARVSGIDASAAMIEAARSRARSRGAEIDFKVARAERVPFPDGTFDIVAAVTMLCFVEDARPVFHEMARVLRPGGRLVIGELGKWSTWAAARRIRAWLGSTLWRAARLRTARELRALAEQAGLKVESVRGAIYYPRCPVLARLLAPADARLGHTTTIGAAFLALCALKPSGEP
jgi:SAM-dependent methyltransferase